MRKLARKLVLCVLYTGLMLGANAVAAGPVDQGLLTGDMEKLILAETPVALPEAVLVDAVGAPVDLAATRGKWLVLNFWATWCAPCRTEMPSLMRLQAAMPDIVVLPVAMGRNPVPAIKKFYADAGVQSLPVARDVDSALAHAMGVMGLPVTVIINPEGQEVARLIGGAEWDSPAALAVLAALMAP